MIAIERLASVFVEVADSLVHDFDLIEFFHRVALHAVEISGEASVGLVILDGEGRLQHMGSSDEDARMLELLQLQDAEGPCRDCFETGVAVVASDLNLTRAIWPLFAPRALEAGLVSVQAFPMRLRDRVIGAMNIFGRQHRLLSAADAAVLQSLADLATIAVIQEQAISRAEVLNAQLQSALDSRVLIEQAKGAVAQALGIPVEEAFHRIRSSARAARLPLTEFASELVAAPELIQHRVAMPT